MEDLLPKYSNFDSKILLSFGIHSVNMMLGIWPQFCGAPGSRMTNAARNKPEYRSSAIQQCTCPRISAKSTSRSFGSSSRESAHHPPAHGAQNRAERQRGFTILAAAFTDRGTKYKPADVKVARIMGEGSYGQVFEVRCHTEVVLFPQL